MSAETEDFIFKNVEWKWIHSREIRADRMQRAPVKAGVSSVDVSCKSCGHVWTARSYGLGKFSTGIGAEGAALLIDCPVCTRQGAIRLGLLNSK